MKYTQYTLIALVVLSLLTIGAIAPAVAQENQDEDSEDVEVGLGQSLSAAVQTATQDLETSVNSVAQQNALKNAESDNVRADIIADEIAASQAEAAEIRDRYNEVIESYEAGDINKGEKARTLAVLSNEAKNINENLQALQHFSEHLPEEAKSRAGLPDNISEAAESELEVVGSDSAQAIRGGILTPGMSVKFDATPEGLDVAVNASEGRVFQGLSRAHPSHGEFNIAEEDAIDIAQAELPEDVTESEVVNVRAHPRGMYDIRFETDVGVINMRVDAGDGEVVSTSERRGPPADVERFVGSTSVFGDKAPGQSDRDSNRGKPDWAGPQDRNDAEYEDQNPRENRGNSNRP